MPLALLASKAKEGAKPGVPVTVTFWLSLKKAPCVSIPVVAFTPELPVMLGKTNQSGFQYQLKLKLTYPQIFYKLITNQVVCDTPYILYNFLANNDLYILAEGLYHLQEFELY